MHRSYLTAVVMFEVVHLALSRITQDPNDLTVPPDDNKEPSCEELRTMWRHTKREMQHQQSEMASPRYQTRYHEPYGYGWKAPARPRNAMYSKAVYGRVVHSPDQFLYRNSQPNRPRLFDQVARMIGSSTNLYTVPVTAQRKPMYFRLDYPARRPSVTHRKKPGASFQELRSALRKDRAAELQMMQLKDGTDGTGSSNSDFRDEGDRSRYDTYRYPQSSEDDVAAVNTGGRKLRGTDENSSDSEGYAENSNTDETDSLHSTSKPVSMDDSIPRRWALGWKR